MRNVDATRKAKVDIVLKTIRLSFSFTQRVLAKGRQLGLMERN